VWEGGGRGVFGWFEWITPKAYYCKANCTKINLGPPNTTSLVHCAWVGWSYNF
jgi:hypothetical protein